MGNITLEYMNVNLPDSKKFFVSDFNAGTVFALSTGMNCSCFANYHPNDIP